MRSIFEPFVLFFNLKSATAICPFKTLVKIFLILLLELSSEIVRVTSVVPKAYCPPESTR
jgi:hypothetical protein